MTNDASTVVNINTCISAPTVKEMNCTCFIFVTIVLMIKQYYMQLDIIITCTFSQEENLTG